MKIINSGVKKNTREIEFSHKPTPNKTISELSKKQLNLRLQKESCSDPEKRSSIQKERNRILKQIKKEVKIRKRKRTPIEN